MLDFQSVRDEQIDFTELVAGLEREDLAKLTNEMVDYVLDLISGCVDADVVFEPLDPIADDPYAKEPGEVAMPWTLGHVIVHNTASAEESAALAAELARGVTPHGRSRYEVPWREMRTIAGCRKRLEESRRMRLASLEMWPDVPYLKKKTSTWKGGPRVNGVGRFVLGLMHTDSHLGQIEDIVKQAQADRRVNS